MNGKQPFALHGYQPVLVSELLLSDDEKQMAFKQGMRSILDVERKAEWEQVLTEAELAEREELRTQFKQNSSRRLDSNSKPLPDEFRFRRLGMLRQFARDKYGNGKSVIYGDGCLANVRR